MRVYYRYMDAIQLNASEQVTDKDMVNAHHMRYANWEYLSASSKRYI